jgi:hypothetical protein
MRQIHIARPVCVLERIDIPFSLTTEVSSHLQAMYAAFSFDAVMMASHTAFEKQRRITDGRVGGLEKHKNWAVAAPAGYISSSRGEYPLEINMRHSQLIHIPNAQIATNQGLPTQTVNEPENSHIADAMSLLKTSKIEAISTFSTPIKKDFRAWIDTNGWLKMWADLYTLVAVLIDNVTLPLFLSQHERDLLVKIRHNYFFTWLELSESICIAWHTDQLEQVYALSTRGWLGLSDFPSELTASMAGWSDADLLWMIGLCPETAHAPPNTIVSTTKMRL